MRTLTADVDEPMYAIDERVQHAATNQTLVVKNQCIWIGAVWDGTKTTTRVHYKYLVQYDGGWLNELDQDMLKPLPEPKPQRLIKPIDQVGSNKSQRKAERKQLEAAELKRRQALLPTVDSKGDLS